MHMSNAFLILSLSVLSTALPALVTGSDTRITASRITTITPKLQSCANAPVPKCGVPECANAQEAAVNIRKSFETYNVTSRVEQAAVIALMVFESVEFQFSRKQGLGVKGQGTRNMQSPTYNKRYTTSIPSLKDKSQCVNTGEVLNLLLANKEYNFGSGAWFLTTQCSSDVRTALQKGDEQGWEQYITGCMGTEASQSRKVYWKRAVGALAYLSGQLAGGHIVHDGVMMQWW